jgi:hypothetical protein
VRNRSDDEQVAKLQDAILQYLAAHPRASDSVRGIARFWIESTARELPPQDAVQRALDDLTARGRIRCTVLFDGTRVYEAASVQPPGS